MINSKTGYCFLRWRCSFDHGGKHESRTSGLGFLSILSSSLTWFVGVFFSKRVNTKTTKDFPPAPPVSGISQGKVNKICRYQKPASCMSFVFTEEPVRRTSSTNTNVSLGFKHRSPHLEDQEMAWRTQHLPKTLQDWHNDSKSPQIPAFWSSRIGCHIDAVDISAWVCFLNVLNCSLGFFFS